MAAERLHFVVLCKIKGKYFSLLKLNMPLFLKIKFEMYIIGRIFIGLEMSLAQVLLIHCQEGRVNSEYNLKIMLHLLTKEIMNMLLSSQVSPY